MELITYETIRSVHRAEKEEELQKLPEGFFESVKNWLSQKEKQKDTVSLLEVENAKKLLEDIINRRQKKIVLSALRTVRGELPPPNLSNEERRFFDKIVDNLKDFRDNMNEKFKGYDKIVEEKIEETKKTIEKMEPIEKKDEKRKVLKPKGKLLVKILDKVPRFVGPDLKSYGPLNVGDVITLPEKLGRLLISRKLAENILE